MPLNSLVAIAALMIVGFGFATVQTLEMLTLGVSAIVVRLLGWFCFVGVAIFMASLWHHVSRGILIGACAAAVVLIVHAQVEMTIEQPMTVPWILAVFAIATPVQLAQYVNVVAHKFCGLLG